MGYDAHVRCNCFKKGKVKPFKYIQYVVDATEGYELNLPQSIQGTPLQDTIESEFDDWKNFSCEHDYQEYYTTRICNVSGMSHFGSTLELLNGKETLPTLYECLPESNDGFVPFEKNEDFKKDLLKMKNMGKIRTLILYVKSNDGDVYINHAVNGDSETFFFHPKVEMGLNENSFFIKANESIAFESKKFSIEKIEDSYLFFDEATKTACFCPAFFNDDLFKSQNFIKMYVEEHLIDINEAHGYIIDTLLTLVEKSNEIGNPICWA